MSHGARRARHARVLAGVGLVAVMAAVSACEGTPSQAPSPTPTPEPTPTISTYLLATTVWYAGLQLTFGTATAVLDQRGGPVTADLELQNPGPDDLTLSAPIRLLVAGTSYEPARETVLPSVPSLGGSFTTLKFNVFGSVAMDQAVIQVGAPDRHQGIVPFTAGTVAPVVLQPVDLSPSGSTTASDLRLVLSHGLLRWDLPDWADELPATSAALILTYDVSYVGSFSGGVPFTGDNIRLVLPDGRVIGPRADGRSQSVGVLLPGQTLRQQSTRFEIPAGVTGKYTLELVENGKQGKITFTVPS